MLFKSETKEVASLHYLTLESGKGMGVPASFATDCSLVQRLVFIIIIFFCDLSGEMHWPDGRHYTGEFKLGLQHG